MKKRPLIFYGWYLVGVSFLTIALLYGTRYSFSVFYDTILEHFHWSRADTATIFSANIVVYGLTAPFFGALIDRFGPRVALPLGAALTALGMGLSSLAGEIWHFYVLFGVFVALGTSCAGFAPNSVVLANWFTRRRATAFGIALSGGGGSFLFAAFAQYLISSFDWRNAYIILGGLVAGILIPLTALVMRRQPSDLGLAADGDLQPASVVSPPIAGGAEDALVVDRGWAATNWTLRRAVVTGRFWALFLATLLFWGFGVNLVLAHQVIFVVDSGYGKALAATVFGFYGVVNAAGNLFGFISDRIGREMAYSLGCALAVLALGALSLSNDPSQAWLLYLYVLLFGPGVGLIGPTGTAAIADLFQGRNFGSINGFIVAGFGVGGSVGPWLGGYIYDVTGSYNLAFLISALSIAAAALLIWIAAPRKVRLVSGKAPATWRQS